MKVEIYFTADRDFNVLDNILIDHNVVITRQIRNKIYAVSFETDVNNVEENARLLSEILDRINNQGLKYFISDNEPANYYNIQLYPHYNSFERKLRKLVYMLAIQSNDMSLNEVAYKINELTFGEIASALFDTKKPVQKYCQYIKKSENTKFYSAKALESADDKTLWSFMVKEDSFILQHFEQIRTYRNATMHAHDISYLEYCKALSMIQAANVELDALIQEYGCKIVYNRPDIQKIINELKNCFKK